MKGYNFQKSTGVGMPIISEEMRATYLKRRHADLDKCRFGLKTNEWESIGRIGHKMKGNAETFGFEALTEIGDALENSAQEQDLAKTTSVLDQFAKVLAGLSPEAEH